MNTVPDFKIRLTDEQRRKVASLAKREGITPQDWLNREAGKVARVVLGESNDMDPKMAGAELGVSRYSIIRYFNQGLFPKAYLLNQRVIRIPRADVEKVKSDRRLVRA